MNLDLNLLPKKHRLMVIDFLNNPSRKRALEFLEETPVIVLVADKFLVDNELKESLKNILAEDLDKVYIFQFLQYNICSLFDCKLSSLQFIMKHGSKSNCKVAKKANMELKLGP